MTATVAPPNPFLLHAVEDTRQKPPFDVPELHARPYGRCVQVIGDVQAKARAGVPQPSASVVVQGPAGSGKSHLIARLRDRYREDEAVVVACVRLATTAGRLWRFIRQELVTELLAAGPGGEVVLARVLRRRFPSWDPNQPPSPVGRLLGGGGLGRHLTEAVAEQLRVQWNTSAALKVLFDDRASSDLARAWLRGERLGGEQLRRLGLPEREPTDADHEAESREVVLSLARLAGRTTTLVLCFDQVEGLQVTTTDRDSLAVFANHVTELVADPQAALAAVVFCRSDILADLKKYASTAIWQRLTALPSAHIPPLLWDDVVRLYRTRVAGAVGESDPRDGYWPLGEAFLRRAFDAKRRVYTPRQLLLDCSAEFARRYPADGEPQEPVPLPPEDGVGLPDPTAGVSPPAAVDRLLRGEWDRRAKALRDKVTENRCNLAFEKGLPWLMEVLGHPFTAETRVPARYEDFTLLFYPSEETAGGSVGLSVVANTPRGVHWRLKRLGKQWDLGRQAGDVGELVVVRPFTMDCGRVGQELLDGFRGESVRVVRPPTQQLAGLAAVQEMFTDAQNDRLVLGSRPIRTDQVTGWASRELPRAVGDLLVAIFGGRLAVPAGDEPSADPKKSR